MTEFRCQWRSSRICARGLGLGAAIWLGIGVVALGCDVPVFQYALALWQADPYEVVVAHREEVAAGELIAALTELERGGGVNLVVRDVVLGGAGGQYSELVEGVAEGGESRVFVRYPVRGGERKLVWSGSLAEFKIGEWLESRVRRELVYKLQHNAAGVWLFVGGGNRGEDEAAFGVMNSELDRLQRVLRLSGTYEDGREPPAPEFGRMRLERSVAEEWPLLRMLMQSEAGLAGQVGVPMVFPIYGRGMMLYALVGAGINSATITEAAEFLVGECACEVKSDNPGLELLLSAEWDEMQIGAFGDFESRGEQALVAVEDIRGSVASSMMDEILGGGEGGEGGRGAVWEWVVLAAIVGVVGWLAGWFLMRKGGGR